MNGYVYILQCSDNSFYVGETAWLVNRLVEHYTGYGAHYTKARRPVRVVYAFESNRRGMDERQTKRDMKECGFQWVKGANPSTIDASALHEEVLTEIEFRKLNKQFPFDR